MPTGTTSASSSILGIVIREGSLSEGLWIGVAVTVGVGARVAVGVRVGGAGVELGRVAEAVLDGVKDGAGVIVDVDQA